MYMLKKNLVELTSLPEPVEKKLLYVKKKKIKGHVRAYQSFTICIVPCIELHDSPQESFWCTRACHDAAPASIGLSPAPKLNFSCVCACTKCILPRRVPT